MIITFSDQKFVEMILLGTKLFTIRDSNRFKPDQKLQLWYRNPRHVHLNPYHFANAEVEKVEELEMNLSLNTIMVNYPDTGDKFLIYDLLFLAKLDGFNSVDEMKKFFPEDKTRFRIWFKNVVPVN